MTVTGNSLARRRGAAARQRASSRTVEARVLAGGATLGSLLIACGCAAVSHAPIPEVGVWPSRAELRGIDCVGHDIQNHIPVVTEIEGEGWKAWGASTACVSLDATSLREVSQQLAPTAPDLIHTKRVLVQQSGLHGVWNVCWVSPEARPGSAWLEAAGSSTPPSVVCGPPKRGS